MEIKKLVDEVVEAAARQRNRLPAEVIMADEDRLERRKTQRLVLRSMNGQLKLGCASRTVVALDIVELERVERLTGRNNEQIAAEHARDISRYAEEERQIKMKALAEETARRNAEAAKAAAKKETMKP